MSDNVMRQEILQQPAVCGALFEREAAGLERFVRRLKARPPKGVVLAARGSSDHAAVYGRYLLEELLGLPVALAAPSLVTLYGAKPRFRDYLVIGVSQSGQGPDINAVMQLAARQGAPTLGLTNDPKSGLARVSSQVLHLGADKEQAVAATKTFTAELAGLALLGALWSGKPALRKALQALPRQMGEALMQTELPAQALGRRLRGIGACTVVGRGYQLGVAHEMGLKMKECAGIPALSYSVADFAHGPVSLAQKGFPVFYLSAPGRLEGEGLAATKDFLARGARVFRVGLRDKAVARLPRSPRLDLSLLAEAGRGLPECFSPLLSILPGQWFSYYVALAKGLDPARPKGLKKVTKTR